jgi:hypothetical protein
MENIKDRLQETVKICVESHDEWVKDAKNTAARQNLEAAVHELRKVTSRIEIEMAISDRSNSSMKPMPIPPHRASRPKGHKQQEAPLKKAPTVSLNNHTNKDKDTKPSAPNAEDAPKKTAARGRTKLKAAEPKVDDAE